MKWGAALLLAVAGIGAAVSASAMAEEKVKPDFSNVRSRQDAEALVAQGKLVRISMFPTELGGPETVENISYTTPEAAEARTLAVSTLRRFGGEGLIDHLTVTPEYKGDSFVPSRIVMHATSHKKKGEFHPTIDVW